MFNSTTSPSNSFKRLGRLSSGTTGQLALAAGISLMAVSASSAALQLTFDLRAVAISAVNAASVSSPTALISNNGHTVQVADNTLGSTIVFNLYAVFNETVATDSFTKTQGALVSSGTTGGLAGSITAAIQAANLRDGVSGAQAGAGNVELSGVFDPAHGLLTAFTAGSAYANHGTADAILDWGDTVVNRNLTPGAWFVPGNASPILATVDGNGLKSVLLGEFTLSLNAGSAGTTTEGFYVRPKGTAAASAPVATYNYNGAAQNNNYLGNAGTAVSPTDGYAFSNVNITAAVVPEPSAFGMLALGALGLVGFRRLGLRRTV